MRDEAPTTGGSDDGQFGFRTLRLASIIGPAAFVAMLFVGTLLLIDVAPLALLVSAAMLAVVVAGVAFSWVISNVMDRAERQLRERNRQLAAVQSAATDLASEQDRTALLDRFVELSRSITDAHYGALAIRRPDGSIEQFITAGISEEARAAIGHLPVGRGLLGVNIFEGRPVRLAEIGKDPRSVGFPPHHPPMTSLLGVPVVSKGEIIGNLYLTDKMTAARFSETDEEMVRLFAAYAAAAVETARLQEQLRTLALVQDRQRIAMDLHDGIIQSIYAVGLKLEGASDDASSDSDAARASIDEAIDDLSDVIRDVRSYILELRPADVSGDIASSLRTLADNFRANSLIDASLEISNELPELGLKHRNAVFHIAQEALANARKHSRATRVSLSVAVNDGAVELHVRDNGQGFEPSSSLPAEHHGVRNMESRAHAVGGTLTVESARGAGTTVRLAMPLDEWDG